MKFSEYTITQKPEQSVDPLGFTQPFGALRSRWYAQFTVLSNSPAYHGVLALVYQLLAERETTPGMEKFTRRFREAECLWGLANVTAGQSILNVTKYQAILEGRSSIALKDIGYSNAIFRSLAYGTLGHYSNPSVAWCFLERGAARLTPLGNQLADAFATRERQSLRGALERWLDGKAITSAELQTLGNAYSIDKTPLGAERKVWRAAVHAWCNHAPDTRAIWTDPPTADELQTLRDDAAAYRNFFPVMATRFPRLAQSFEQADRFEAMSAVCLFLFEREYLLCHDAGPALPAPGDVESQLAAALARLAKEYMAQNFNHDTKGLFGALAVASGHSAITTIIMRHHVDHQKGKNTQPYMDNGELRVRDRFDRQAFTALHEELADQDSANERVALLTYRYRRDWHFDRAVRYARYFGEKV